ncbi:MAG: hypothetical protein ACKVH0_06580 [Alphaproteobacteria bacterium]
MTEAGHNRRLSSPGAGWAKQPSSLARIVIITESHYGGTVVDNRLNSAYADHIDGESSDREAGFQHILNHRPESIRQLQVLYFLQHTHYVIEIVGGRDRD